LHIVQFVIAIEGKLTGKRETYCNGEDWSLAVSEGPHTVSSDDVTESQGPESRRQQIYHQIVKTRNILLR